MHLEDQGTVGECRGMSAAFQISLAGPPCAHHHVMIVP
jgi:hypothetical protein